jgi:hypothetical protein
MSFQNQVQLKQHCDSIMQSRRIKNKIVVLCEGNIHALQGRPSPQSYRRLENMPDANFYKACIPKWWAQKRPEFFVCGDRKDVIDTFFTLLEQHNQPQQDSYLNPDKLFAIVDLDIQSQVMNQNYPFPNTEAIFKHLYDKAKVNTTNANQHRIWVTGLIHKEAYFIEPALQSVFDTFSISLTFNGIPLKLEDIYLAISENLENDRDLKDNFPKVCHRINYLDLDCRQIESLKKSWKQQFHTTLNKTELIYALLTITKAKDYWHQIAPKPDEWTGPIEQLREMLTLKIGQFYSEVGEEENTNYHIPVFLKILSQFR